jgi:fluoride exporter
MLTKLLWLALAGALGTLTRYLLSGLVQQTLGASFPWGTLAVNLTGCFLAGALAAIFEHHAGLSGELRVVLFIGFLGALTTFSTFVLETGQLLRDAQWAWALLNAALQNLAGLAAMLIGFAAGRNL